MSRARGGRVRTDFDPRALAPIAAAAARSAAEAAGEVILRRSAEIAPRRTGRLAGSGRRTVDGARATVAYGVDYAAIQHEKGGLRHPGGGQAGFLSAAVTSAEAARTLTEAFAEEWQRGCGGR